MTELLAQLATVIVAVGVALRRIEGRLGRIERHGRRVDKRLGKIEALVETQHPVHQPQIPSFLGTPGPVTAFRYERLPPLRRPGGTGAKDRVKPRPEGDE